MEIEEMLAQADYLMHIAVSKCTRDNIGRITCHKERRGY